MIKRKYKSISIIAIILLTTCLPAFAVKFDIVTPQSKVTIVYAQTDHKLDSITAHLLAADIQRVSGYLPQVITNISKAKGNIIIIGTLQSKLIRSLSLNTDFLQGKWESYTLQVISNPLKNINKVLVIAGSDLRGMAYGVFDVSERIGVSPWYWWADVKPVQQKVLSLTIDAYTAAPPSVKFRGIFINDEDWGLQPWAANTFEPETGDIGPKTYAKVFELLLRLKANLIWPAMHPSTKAFYSYPGNIKVAADYEIVVGSSHAEPMLRNNVGEWDEKTMGHFNYVTNKQKVYEYWESRVKESSANDAIYTMGMRGVHDSGMEGVKGPKEAVPLLEQIIADQRGLLKKYINPDVTKVPQVFTAYKEVLDVYDNGLKVPGDITLVWPDDNYGYIQRLNNNEEQGRKGGSGIYYHASYWGRPHDYLWLSTTSPALIREEMMKAYELQSKDLWVLNAGDIKPGEYDMQLFLDMAYRADAFKNSSYLKTHLQQWCTAKWGAGLAPAITQILQKYYQLAWERRPEFMGWSQTEPTTPTKATAYNHFAWGDEAQKRLDSYLDLQQKVKVLYENANLINKDAFFELVYYPVAGASLMNQKLLYADKAYLYAKQNRLAVDRYNALSEIAYQSILNETANYNSKLAGGKWKGIMSMHPRDLPVYKQSNRIPLKVDGAKKWSIAPEGTEDSVSVSKQEFSLPRFDRLNRQSYFIDVYLTDYASLSWTAVTSQPWIKLSSSHNTLHTTRLNNSVNQNRVLVSIDWSAVPSQQNQLNAKIIFKGSGQEYTVNISVDNTVHPELANYKGFVENNGYVSVFAGSYSAIKANGSKGWQADTTLGYAQKALVALPLSNSIAADTSLAAAPYVIYDFYTFSNSGNPQVGIFTLPTHPLNKKYSMRYAVAVDAETPAIVNFKTEGRSAEWKNNVLSNNAIRHIALKALKPGKHQLKLYMIDPGVIVDRILINLANNYKPAYSLVPETRMVNPK